MTIIKNLTTKMAIVVMLSYKVLVLVWQQKYSRYVTVMIHFTYLTLNINIFKITCGMEKYSTIV